MTEHQINPECVVRDVVVIGASEGGFSAIVDLLSRLPGDLPAIIGIVIHRGAQGPSDWSSALAQHARLRVVEPVNGTLVSHGVVYVAASDRHMTFRDDAVFLDRNPKVHHTRPAVNPLFASAALAYGSRVLGILLTGGGTDGTQGLRDITKSGGLSLVQSPNEARNPAMPQHAMIYDDVSAALSIEKLGRAIVELAHGRSFDYLN